MKHIEIGDVVKTSNGSFSKVFLFSHRDPDATSLMIEIQTRGGQSLTVRYFFSNPNLGAR